MLNLPSKQDWGPGPWHDEPDRAEWTHAGLPCVASRHPEMGHWCGYVGVPPEHPWFQHGYSEGPPTDLSVHGGLTFAGAGVLFGVVNPAVWWFGFDCSHAFDVAPGLEALLRQLRQRDTAFRFLDTTLQVLEAATNPFQPVYRDLSFVRAETESLAQQLVAVGRETR